MTNIYDLTNLLREVRSCYQAEFIDATETKKKELELLKSGYIPGSKPYLEKEQEIEKMATAIPLALDGGLR